LEAIVPEYLNPHPHDLYLVGPSGDTIHIRKGRRVRLPDFFDRYASKDGKGYLVNVDQIPSVPQKREIKTSRQAARPVQLNKRVTKEVKRQIVGRMRRNVDLACSKSFSKNAFAISDGIGVGILTYNRPKSLYRLVTSIIKYTDTCRTTIFISDDGSTNTDQLAYLSELELRGDIVILRNCQQLGVAGNSNRLMRCLSRFPKKILLNDDVEVLNSGWEHFYFLAMQRTGFHHFCYRQLGVYGATKGINTNVNNTTLNVVDSKPHGAVMVFDHTAFSKVGYFDEQFGQYGVEHVDWSTRLSDSKLQQPGFFDVDGSSSYFLVHPEHSSVENRVEKFKHAKAVLSTISTRPSYVNASDITAVPRISCVIPFREIDRKNSIITVLNSIRAQRFPDIEIVMVEEDTVSKMADAECDPARHIFVAGLPGAAFNKSKAWNAGVSACTCDMLILHDADTLAPSCYFQSVANELSEVESCHLCKQIFYIGATETNNINITGTIDHPRYEHMVDYFEGGSIACRRKAYWKVGGFVEEFVGYGVEDCDFYFRLSRGTVWKENRHFDLLHLHHGRVENWTMYHQKNKEIGAKLSALSLGDRITRQRLLLTQSGRGHCLGE
jgi:GT2 family glycosyltransferase